MSQDENEKLGWDGMKPNAKKWKRYWKEDGQWLDNMHGMRREQMGW